MLLLHFARFLPEGLAVVFQLFLPVWVSKRRNGLSRLKIALTTALVVPFLVVIVLLLMPWIIAMARGVNVDFPGFFSSRLGLQIAAGGTEVALGVWLLGAVVGWAMLAWRKLPSGANSADVFR